VVAHWRRLAGKQGAAKDAEAERIDDEHLQLARLAEAARVPRRLRPKLVVSWTSDPPFPATATYIPVIGEDLATIGGLGYPEWLAMQDRVLLVVCPERSAGGELFGAARVYGAPPGTPPPDRSVAPEPQGWSELGEGDFLIPWLLYFLWWEVPHRQGLSAKGS